jgi:DNA invertase Pin-like site-specific DNA recombinase
MISESATRKLTSDPVPAAQYLRMSTERQEYSLDFQQAIICAYARNNNFTIVRTYTDAGKSGLALKHRAGLSALLQDAISGAQHYRAILVYDVSRWGRFQDADESAHYEFLCRRAGVPIHYCAEVFSNDGTMPSAIMKTLKRIMAAEFSRELSEKVTLAMTCMVKDRLWVGARPGYGLRRMLVSPDGTHKTTMEFHQTKNFRTDRTILVPGPREEMEVVKEIFRLYVNEKRGFLYIARRLNDLKIPYQENRPWRYQAVRHIITNEKYTGALIWGRYTQKLKSRSVPVPREKWLVVRDAFEPLVDRNTFETAGRVWKNKGWQLSDAQFLDRLRSLLRAKGRLNARIVNESSLTPSCSAYIRRFGSLIRTYELIGYKRSDTFDLRKQAGRSLTGIYRSVYARLQRLFPDIRVTHESTRARPKTLRFSSGLTIAVAVCPADRTLKGERRWRFESCHAQKSGLVTLMCMCKSRNQKIDHFLVIPNASDIPVISMLKEADVRLASATKLRSLVQLCRVAHRMGRVSSASPAKKGGGHGTASCGT